jgi:hypothetical protein
LIEKEIDGTLTTAESIESGVLQREVTRLVDAAHPRQTPGR